MSNIVSTFAVGDRVRINAPGEYGHGLVTTVAHLGPTKVLALVDGMEWSYNPDELELLSPTLVVDSRASIERGLADSAAGRVHDLGSFEQYADEDEVDPNPKVWVSTLSRDEEEELWLAHNSMLAILGIFQNYQGYTSKKKVLKDIRRIVTKKWGGVIDKSS